MYTEQDILQRSQRLLGPQAMEQLKQARVIVFGVGGVGSWCAESLVRTGIGRLTLVDNDTVSVSNINRQLMATVSTVGRPKVEVLKERLLDINPYADITAIDVPYTQETAPDFHLENYDYIIDAIDSLEHKCQLILHATAVSSTAASKRAARLRVSESQTGSLDFCPSESRLGEATLFSSMGAALKLDPTSIRVAEFWNVQGCPLARAIRQRFKQRHTFPAKKFSCVFSPERLSNQGADPQQSAGTWDSNKAQINGSLPHITAIFGFTLAGLVIQDVCLKNAK